jgi:hypothetical protein
MIQQHEYIQDYYTQELEKVYKQQQKQTSA